MRLYIETMDAFLVEFAPDGRMRFDNEQDWTRPTVQERRAIIHAAQDEIESLQELLETLERANL